MKRSPFARVCIWSFILVVLIGVLLDGLGFIGTASDSARLSGFQYVQAEDYTTGPASLTVKQTQQVRKIDLHWLNGTVDIVFYDGENIQFSETSNRTLQPKDEMHYRVKGDTLSIQFSASQSNNWFAPTKSIELLVPSSLPLSSLSLEGVSNSVSIDGAYCRVRSVDIESVSGAVTLSNLWGDTLGIETVSGDVEVLGSFTKVNAEAVSGAQLYRLWGAPEKVDVQSVSGSILFHLAESIGFTAKLDTVSGALVADHAEQTDRKTVTYGDGRAQFKLETVSGSVRFLLDAQLGQNIPADAVPDASASAPTSQGTPIPSSQRGF